MNPRKIVITGGSSGIGFASAKLLVARGDEVVLAARNRDRLDAAKSELGERTSVHELDVRDEDAVQEFFDRVGPFDHLVTAAGPQAGDAPLPELGSDFARGLFESKYWGQFHAAKHGAAKLRERGSIVLFSAWLARKPTAGFSTFAAVDGAIEAFARVIALELAPRRVNVVSPGIIDTPLWSPFPEPQRREMLQGFGDALPVGRVGAADDVERAVLYLIDNGFSTGAVVDVDGGQF